MRKLYGSSPLHLAGHVLLFALAAYAVIQFFVLDAAVKVVIWLVAAVLLHDAVLWPIYSGADGLGRRVLGGAVNYVRVPLGLSLLLGLVFVGTVSGKGGSTYSSASGQAYDGYVLRWLVVSAALFAISAVVYLARRRSSSRAAPSADSSTTSPASASDTTTRSPATDTADGPPGR